ncbi:hypothetical protein GCWU000324_00780 [Kingella oralis ATCC 51147]|uniref:Uncharacterized protein n=1 Tax=Kingella oralis ATCC 51147 TaxID=629741 RepID=C4GF66_9NEIS|nr:hypothetical protein GCWU000324_00780 [Kingella oralis ATCC 51147]
MQASRRERGVSISGCLPLAPALNQRIYLRHTKQRFRLLLGEAA